MNITTCCFFDGENFCENDIAVLVKPKGEQEYFSGVCLEHEEMTRQCLAEEFEMAAI